MDWLDLLVVQGTLKSLLQSDQITSVTQSCPTLFDPMNHSTPGLPVPVHPKGDQSWVFIGRTDAEAETPLLWPPHVKS